MRKMCCKIQKLANVLVNDLLRSSPPNRVNGFFRDFRETLHTVNEMLVKLIGQIKSSA